jgi:hypothetical protein
MNLYQTLASAKDELRRAKDHEQTIRAIAEYVELAGKNADDRKRELAFVLSQDALYRKAQADLRDAEAAVDQAQAAVDQAENDRRDREWAIRARLAEALKGQHENAAFELASDQRMVGRAKAQAEMDELFTT